MTLYFFLAMASVSVVKSLQNALYLGEVGFDWRLPALYVALALVSGAGVFVYRRLARRFSRMAINLYTLLGLIATLLGFYFLLRLGPSWSYPAFYIWGGVFSILVPTQGWLLSYEFYSTREAKRLFAILGTGGILGGAGGGFYAALAGDWDDVTPLLLHVAVALALMQVLLWLLARSKTNTVSNGLASTKREGDDSSALESVQHMFRSPYLSTLSLLVLMSAFVTTMIDLQYKWVLEERYSGSPGEITEFFGTLLGATFLFSALFQLFATSRLLRSWGVGAGLLLMPAALVAGAIPVAVTAGFAAVVLVKVVDGCLRTSVQKTSVELIYLPISNPQTATVKGFIELVVFRFGDAIGATLFLVASGLVEAPVAAVGLAVAFGALGWVFVSWKMGREYARTLRGILERRTTPAFRKALQSNEAVAESALIEALQSASRAKVHFALNQLIENLSGASEQVFDLPDESGEFFMSGISRKGVGETPRWLDAVEPLMQHHDREVAAAALHLLITHQPERYLTHLKSDCGCDEIPDMLCLYYMDRYVDDPRSLLDSGRLLKWSEQTGQGGARVLTRLMGKLQDHAFLPVLRKWAENRDRGLARNALRSVGRYRQKHDLQLFIKHLSFPWSRKAAAQALAGFGDSVVPMLAELVSDPRVDISSKRETPAILARIGTTMAQEALLAILYYHDPMVSFRALKGLNKIRTRAALPFGEISFSPLLQVWVREHYELLNLDILLGPPASREEKLLKKAVRERLEWGTEKIFRGLELFLPPGDAYFSYLGYTSDDPELRENAIELIDLRIKGELRQTILPIITGDNPREIARFGRRLYKLSADLDRVLSDALFLADPWLKCCIIAVVKARGREELKPRVLQARQDIHALVRETAGWALQTWALELNQ